MTKSQKKAFVIGWPISHSLSPSLHSYWIDEAGISASYEKLAVIPQDLPAFLQNLSDSEYVGGNITIPHKEMAAELIRNKTKKATILGAVNTVWKQQGNLHGDNTDGYGFSSNLTEFSANWKTGKIATVLGAGGAAKAIVNELCLQNYEKIYIVNRTLERANQLVKLFGAKCVLSTYDQISNLLYETDLLVNTTSLGMVGQPKLEIDLSNMKKNAIVTDIVYNPLQTQLLLQAQGLGIQTVDGIGMLLHQAVPGFEKWFGIRPIVTTELRQHMIAKIGADPK